MKIKKFSTVFLCAAVCAALLTGCGEQKTTYLSDDFDNDPAASTLISDQSADTDLPDSSDSSAVNSADGADSSNNSADSSNISSADITGDPDNSSDSSGNDVSETSSAPFPSSSTPQTESQPPIEETSSSEHQHEYQLIKRVDPTCSKVGYEIYKCSCGDQYTETTEEALGHSYSSSVTSPTCVSSGYTTYTCTRCGHSHKDDFKEATGHNYSTKTVKATCTKSGYTIHICSRCGHEYTSILKSAPALGHNWGEWIVTQNATTTSEGEKKAECSRCGETKTASIAKLPGDNSYASMVVQLVNVERAKHNLAPLKIRTDLAEYAQLRSTEITVNFAHERPDGTSPLKYVMSISGVHTAGENIAWGQKTPEAVMTAWMNSEGHRANILNANFTSIGVGCFEYNGRLYWTQIFAG